MHKLRQPEQSQCILLILRLIKKIASKKAHKLNA